MKTVTKQRKCVVRRHKYNLTNFKKKPPKWYVHDLNALVNLCFQRAAKLGLDDATLATRADLSVTTIHNLRNCLTLFPGFLTVCKLCRAMKLNQQYKRLTAKHRDDFDFILAG